MDKLDKVIQESIYQLIYEDNQQDLSTIYQLCHEIVQWSKSDRGDKNMNIEKRSQQIASIWSNNKNAVKYCNYIDKNANKGQYNKVIQNVNNIVEEINQCLKSIFKKNKRENPLWRNVKNKVGDAADRVLNGWLGVNVSHGYNDYYQESGPQVYDKFK